MKQAWYCIVTKTLRQVRCTNPKCRHTEPRASLLHAGSSDSHVFYHSGVERPLVDCCLSVLGARLSLGLVSASRVRQARYFDLSSRIFLLAFTIWRCSCLEVYYLLQPTDFADNVMHSQQCCVWAALIHCLLVLSRSRAMWVEAMYVSGHKSTFDRCPLCAVDCKAQVRIAVIDQYNEQSKAKPSLCAQQVKCNHKELIICLQWLQLQEGSLPTSPASIASGPGRSEHLMESSLPSVFLMQAYQGFFAAQMELAQLLQSWLMFPSQLPMHCCAQCNMSMVF